MIPNISTPAAVVSQTETKVAPPPQPSAARSFLDKDAPTGPPPSFEESFLARQARTALEVPEVSPDEESGDDSAPFERAENGFAEMRAIAAEPATALIDMRS